MEGMNKCVGNGEPGRLTDLMEEAKWYRDTFLSASLTEMQDTFNKSFNELTRETQRATEKHDRTTQTAKEKYYRAVAVARDDYDEAMQVYNNQEREEDRKEQGDTKEPDDAP
jgi:hypothetical protein